MSVSRRLLVYFRFCDPKFRNAYLPFVAILPSLVIFTIHLRVARCVLDNQYLYLTWISCFFHRFPLQVLSDFISLLFLLFFHVSIIFIRYTFLSPFHNVLNPFPRFPFMTPTRSQRYFQTWPAFSEIPYSTASWFS